MALSRILNGGADGPMGATPGSTENGTTLAGTPSVVGYKSTYPELGQCHGMLTTGWSGVPER